MFDTQTRATMPAQPPPPSLQFVTVEIMPVGDGALAVTLGGTFLDEDVLEFVNDEIVAARVDSIDEALIVIRNAVTEALGLGHKTGDTRHV